MMATENIEASAGRYQLQIVDSEGYSRCEARRDPTADDGWTRISYRTRRAAMEARAKFLREDPGSTVGVVDLRPGEPEPGDGAGHLAEVVRETVRGEVHALAAKLTGARVVESTGRATTALLLSQRQAARLLGVSRNTTLRALISNGQLETVLKSGVTMVPRSEVERLAREGFDAAALPSRRARRRTPHMAGLGKYEATDPSTWKIRR
jgi:hypothetical protein